MARWRELRREVIKRLGAGTAAACALCVLAAQPQRYVSTLPVDHAAIQYATAPTDDLVARLIKSGARVRELPELLAALGISTDSQMLVFSKTSLQAERISPRNPRAIYFNDEAAVGWIRGGVAMEVASVDSRQGVIFYSFDSDGFHRQNTCLHCHAGASTQGVPGMFVGSVYPAVSGEADRNGAIITDHRTAFADRWGGWYVNARRGEQKDRANGVAADPSDPHALATHQNLTSLAALVNTAGYLSPVSDIVALMTFEHQTQMTNYLTRVGWEARMGQSVDADIETLARYMTFQNEAPLAEPIEGVSEFTKSFARRGPFDRQGRSLRDFDLKTRLFRYPLSYMIYSAQFDALPGDLRERIYRRVYEQVKSRREVLEILRDTKANLPVWMKAGI